VDFENTFIDGRGTNEIQVRAFQMGAEIGSGFRFVRFDRGLSKIVAHAPENVESSNIQHDGFERKVEKAKEVFRGRKF
jgi:hypothetical protein